MSETTKACALCLQEKPLLDSHFVPASIYKNLINPGGIIKNMVATNLSTASEVSKQVKQYLLCQECEIRLQQGGENWVLGRRLMPSGAFPLREALQQTAPAGTRDGSSFYTLDIITSVDQDQLLYFAASVFWRGAVTDWETPLGHYPKLAMEESIVEDLRMYLLGSGSFPASASILAIISAADDPAQVTALPSITSGVTEYQQIDWIMPGTGFTLLTGEKVPETIRALSLSRSPYAIAISPGLDDRIRTAGIQHAQQSLATEKLQKKLDQEQAR